MPAITNPVVIDGTTQPGYAGTPLIAIVGQGTGDAAPLTVGSDVTVRGVAIGGSSFSSVTSSTMLTVESVPLCQGQGGVVTYQIVLAAGENLVATAQAVGATASLSLLDAQGHVVMQSDGLSAAEPLDAIDTYIAAGTYWLQVQGDQRPGLLHADDHVDASRGALPADRGRLSGSDCHRGGGLHRRRQARPGRRQRHLQRPCRCCWATATAPSSPQSPTR